MRGGSRWVGMLVGLLLVTALGVYVGGCGDPNREDCKKACQKLMECDDTDNGGQGVLTDSWLSSCKSACDEADDINGNIADCIIKTECTEISQECGTGST